MSRDQQAAAGGPARPGDGADSESESDDAPPILGSWRRMYILVLAVFAATVLLFAWLTQVYK